MKDQAIILEKILETFPLVVHPEGGAYLETYRSSDCIRERPISTGIYFLLKEKEFSSFHKIKSDEMWHFYLGGPLEIIEILQDGKISRTVLGSDFTRNEKLQYVVSANNWFAARLVSGSHFSFVGCTVAPGFDFRDFELAERNKLCEVYPMHKILIETLTR